ncbi:MAG: hypothetical protein KDA24_10110 [Deltaproteobacteria bacterium]|nr:hypothetical protein [Deltaproteobacteria bacterium]
MASSTWSVWVAQVAVNRALDAAGDTRPLDGSHGGGAIVALVLGCLFWLLVWLGIAGSFLGL